jgi:hypothetical protein
MNFSLKCKNKFWLENIHDLFCTKDIFPSHNMSLTKQYNAITRFVIVIFIFILVFTNVKKSFIFLIISLLFIIILYYIQKRTMNQKESYEYNFGNTNNQSTKSDKLATVTYMDTLTTNYLNNNNTKNLNNVDILQETNSSYISYNQKLAGKANPKTLIKPIIADRATDLDCWRKNNLVNHSHINSRSHHDEYLSGYKISNCDNSPYTKETHSKCNDSPLECVNNIEYPYHIQNNCRNINTNTYNYNQLSEYNLPSNLPVGNCELNPQMKEYNKNLFTQNIQPNIFTYNELIEPINSNIGISFTKQFNPKTSFIDQNGTNYIEHDPLTFSSKTKNKTHTGIPEYDIYDPRFTGYGTSYRSYNDDNLGQPKFYYDDINSVRMPNYISRSNIDFATYADSYGTLSDSNRNGNINTKNIRELANNSFLNANIEQRESLSESLMRKRNAELWQTRKYPIRTF